jgi:ubiquinone/menaquinone biosynthesis C-methylase UbiE
MRCASTNWLEWWETESVITPSVWRHNMETFVRASDPLLHYGTEDIVLDLGSGPGYLADCLKERVREIHCVDTSQRYVDICREKFAKNSNVFIHRLDREKYTDLSLLGAKRFSLIVCQSVIQYYRAIGEVEDMVRAVRRVAMPGARFLIADIPITGHRSLLTCRLLRTAWRDHRLAEMSKLLFRMATSACGQAYSSLRLLVLSEAQLAGLVNKLGLDAQILSERMTCNDGRRHLFIRF